MITLLNDLFRKELCFDLVIFERVWRKIQGGLLVFTGICNLLGYAMLGLGLEIKTFLFLLY